MEVGTAYWTAHYQILSNVERWLDIEDMLESIAFLHGKKWTSMLIKRCYFGNWLRDYSQAVDVGSLKGVNAATIRILVSGMFVGI